MKKKLLALLLALSMLFSLVGCGGAPDDDSGNQSIGKENVVATGNGNSNNSDNTLSQGLEIIQVLAKGMNAEDGSLYQMEKFVAGKDTVVAVNFDEARDIEQDGSMTLSISKDGQEIIELMPMRGGYNGTTAFFTPKKMEDVGSWAACEYTFHFTWYYINVNRYVASS